MRYKTEIYTRKDGVKVIIVLTHYAGKTVRGIAKCNPVDEFDEARGEELAKARCDYEVAKKRVKNATMKSNRAQEELWKASTYADKMKDYLASANKELKACEKNLKKIVKSF